MVKTRQADIADIPFAEGRALPVEALTLQELHRRVVGVDLSRPQRPSFHHLFLVTRGEGTHTVDFTRHRLRVGSVLHVAPGQVQQFGCEPGLEAALLVFEPDFVRGAPTMAGVPVRPDAVRLATVRALFDAAAREFAAFDGTKAARALLRGLVEALVLSLDAGPPEGEGLALAHAFREALERSFRRAHEVAAYAAVLRCSTRTLTRHATRWLGRPAKEVIDERVALEAKRLLAHGGAPVAKLAAALGFGTATQFVKFFRRATGDTPARFRARYVMRAR